MLGPFFDRDGNGIGAERWQQLVSEPNYSDVARDRFPMLGVVVKTRWIGHDRDDLIPERIFLTTARGDSGVADIATATEAEALTIHGGLCARYREQEALLGSGGSPLLTDGVL
ncbi:hypothetical protein QF031_000958 [Pseudarthrobacter defluvii]|nr:hypothetical protein [Pseudarthrobacter defluvii]